MLSKSRANFEMNEMKNSLKHQKVESTLQTMSNNAPKNAPWKFETRMNAV